MEKQVITSEEGLSPNYYTPIDPVPTKRVTNTDIFIEDAINNTNSPPNEEEIADIDDVIDETDETDEISDSPPLPAQISSVTLFGSYPDINFITYFVDNDIEPEITVVVEDTFFPYVVKILNNENEKGKRYISSWLYEFLTEKYQNDLTRVVYDLSRANSIVPYYELDWRSFVDMGNTQLTIKRNDKDEDPAIVQDRGVFAGFNTSVKFLLQWLDSPTEPGEPLPYLLSYSYIPPEPVKTLYTQNPTAEVAPVITPSAKINVKKKDRINSLQKLLGLRLREKAFLLRNPLAAIPIKFKLPRVKIKVLGLPNKKKVKRTAATGTITRPSLKPNIKL